MSHYSVVRFDGKLEIAYFQPNKILICGDKISCPFCCLGARHTGLSRLHEHYEECAIFGLLFGAQDQTSWDQLVYYAVGIDEKYLPVSFMAVFDYKPILRKQILIFARKGSFSLKQIYVFEPIPKYWNKTIWK